MHVDLKMVKPLIIQEIKYVMKITFLVYYVSAYTSGPLRGPPWARISVVKHRFSIRVTIAIIF